MIKDYQSAVDCEMMMSIIPHYTVRNILAGHFNTLCYVNRKLRITRKL